MGRSQPARHSARAQQACVLRHLPKDSQRSGACSLATRMPGARWRPQLARRTTALRRKREVFRWRSVTLWRVGRTKSLRHAACAASSRVSPRSIGSQRNGACSLATRMPGARWRPQLARHTTALRRKREVFCWQSGTLWRIKRSQPARHAARAASSRVSPPPERQPAQWCLFTCHAKAGCAMEVTAGTSHHGLTLNIRGLSPVQDLSMMRRQIATSAARRACATSLRFTPPPKRQQAQWLLFACNANAGCVLEVTAGTSHHGLILRIGRFSPAQGLCMMRGPIATSAARRACAASLRFTPPSKRQPAQWCLFACHAKAGSVLKVTAGTSHHGLTLSIGRFSPVQGLYV